MFSCKILDCFTKKSLSEKVFQKSASVKISSILKNINDISPFFYSPIEHCLDTDQSQLWRVEICLNAFFIFHFIIRVSWRSNHRRWTIKNSVLKNFVISTGKHLCWSLFLIKLQVFIY